MPSYFHVMSAGHGRFWFREDNGVRYLHHENGEHLANHHPPDQGPDRQAAGAALFPSINVVVVPPALPPARYYPRIYRPHAAPLTERHGEIRAATVHAMGVRMRRLREVFEYIEPRGANLKTFGHATRDLLVLACTEVESAWRGVLRENGYKRRDSNGQIVLDRRGHPIKSKHWNVTDYVHLAAPMRLAEWEVAIVGHPRISRFRPFDGWTPSAAVLPWYDAYNKVKHDREKRFALATVETCIHALGGLFVMLYAQFGTLTVDQAFLSPIAFLFGNHHETTAADLFHLTREPTWQPGEYYAPPGLAGLTDAQCKPRKMWKP